MVLEIGRASLGKVNAQVDNRRKRMVASVSFAQLGQNALTTELCWVPLVVVRTNGVVDNVVGGWSAMHVFSWRTYFLDRSVWRLWGCR